MVWIAPGETHLFFPHPGGSKGPPVRIRGGSGLATAYQQTSTILPLAPGSRISLCARAASASGPISGQKFCVVGEIHVGQPVRAPPEVSRMRGHKLAKPRSDRLSSNLGHSNPRSRARRWVLAARSWDFLSLPNFAPEVFVHARRHVFVVRMRDVFAYRLRVLEAVTANAAMPLVAGEDVRTPLGAFRVVFGIGHFQNPVKRTATTTVTAPTTTAGQS